MRYFTNLIFFIAGFVAQSQVTLDRVEPPSWWVGMNNQNLQLMIYGNDISTLPVEIDYPGVSIVQSRPMENPNYLIIDLVITKEVKVGTFKIEFQDRKRKRISYDYELSERVINSASRQSFGTEDVLYLITPDRFVNGNPKNDNVEGMKESLNRELKGGRHGGDIQGMITSLDYIKDLGFTALWMNPLLENNMEEYSYHGYSTTDFYKVDPRFGTNEEYQKLVTEAHEKGLKIIMDMIVNHGGSNHWWMRDLPASNWVNNQEGFLKGDYQGTSHRKTTIQDPYVSNDDLSELTEGWFVPTMPDLNQENPVMGKYLIQNSIWWIEYLNLDGIRMDTYSYPGKEYMAEWTCAIQEEYPFFNTVGEEWHEDPTIVAHWQQGKINSNEYSSCLPSLMDFPLQVGVKKALLDEEDNWSGWLTAYEALAKDFLYADPMKLVVFPDNHDMSRFYSQMNEDLDLFKLGIAYFTTVRGTPQFYYGTEILMKNPGTDDHGIIRSDFPGGWPEDTVSAFSSKGLTEEQIVTQNYFKKILNWRKNQTTIHTGKLIHYAPKDGLYVFFRYDENDKVMVILSKNREDRLLKLDRFEEMIQPNQSGVDIISNKKYELNDSIMVPAMTALIIDLF